MLKVISLHTLQQIFETEATDKLTPMAKMSYISALMYYFQDKPATTEFCTGFDIDKKEIKMTEATIRYFHEMQDAGLVIIHDRHITFLNHWNRHIDKKQLERTNEGALLQLMSWKPVQEFEQELLKNQEIFELMGMANKLSEATVKEQMAIFIKEQSAVKKHYAGATDCYRHFVGWLNKKSATLPKTGSVKSTGKILGRDENN